MFLHWSGEGVGAVKRGKANAANKPLRKIFGPTNLDFFAATREAGAYTRPTVLGWSSH